MSRHHSRSSSVRRPRGFTIVELLVVISIIALLVSLLLPSLSKAREAAIDLRCASQLHQHGVAMSAYQTDYHNYYPAFGGTAAYGYANWFYTQTLGEAFALDDNKGTEAYFYDYMNGGNPGNRSLQQVDYCPAIDWNSWGQYSFDNGSYYYLFQSPLPTGWAGYNFYTGRKFFGGDGQWVYDYDTRVRREDPREILATDLLEEVMPYCGAWTGYYNGRAIYRSTAVPWFNPHSGSNNTTTRQGDFHQLVGSGAVAQYRYDDAHTAPTLSYGSACLYMYANAATLTHGYSDDGLDSGPYFQGY
jgi:prepilin-type N-terminal cleavage/methylation domain-containing protein